MSKQANLSPITGLGYMPWSNRVVDIDPASDDLRVAFGQSTFDAEGLEIPGRYFSRQITWPGGSNSGVTIGRGYDMGSRTQLQVVRELTLAGAPKRDAVLLSSGAGLRGQAAEQYVRNRRSVAPPISLPVQKRLFQEITTPEIINDIKRIFAKSSVVQQYGEVVWEDLPLPVRELVFDLRYRGDYTTRTRERVQPTLVNQDYESLKRIIDDTAYWRELGVPTERIHLRQEILPGFSRPTSKPGVENGPTTHLPLRALLEGYEIPPYSS